MLTNEIAHELMHQNGNRPQDMAILELEAESVAYVIARHFGMDGLECPNYVSLHCADAKMILAHLERIRNTSAEIISGVERVASLVRSNKLTYTKNNTTKNRVVL